jgi:hypothetical protein
MEMEMIEHPIPLDELVTAQGVQPVHDLDAIGALLPDDWDADAFHAWLMTQRRGE